MLPKSCTTTRRPRRIRFIPPTPLAIGLFCLGPTAGWLIARLVMHLRDAS